MIKIERIMNMSSKDNSLIEIAVELLQKKQRPQNINSIIKEVMSIKGIKAAEVSAYAPQFVMDFMLSGYFVYCGEDCWDLKDRQPTSVLDKDGGDYEDFLDNNDEVVKNELKDGAFGASYTDENNYESPIIIEPTNDEEDDEDEEEENEEDDLSNEFEVMVGSVEEDEEEEEF